MTNKTLKELEKYTAEWCQFDRGSLVKLSDVEQLIRDRRKELKQTDKTAHVRHYENKHFEKIAPSNKGKSWSQLTCHSEGCVFCEFERLLGDDSQYGDVSE